MAHVVYCEVKIEVSVHADTFLGWLKLECLAVTESGEKFYSLTSVLLLSACKLKLGVEKSRRAVLNGMLIVVVEHWLQEHL